MLGRTICERNATQIEAKRRKANSLEAEKSLQLLLNESQLADDHPDRHEAENKN